MAEIARETDIPRTSLYRVLNTLEHLQCVVYDEASNSYTLGMRLWKLGYAYLDQSNLYSRAETYMRELAEVWGESVFLGVFYEQRVTYVRQMENPKSVMAVRKLGKHAPAHCTATGRAILAFLSEREVNEFFSATLTACSGAAGVDSEMLREELQKVQKERVAIVDGAYDPELLCISSPVFDDSFRPAASLTVAMLSVQAKKDRVRRIAEAVKRAAKNLSNDLGHLGEVERGPTDGSQGSNSY